MGRPVSKADSKRACGLDGWMDGHAPPLLAEGGKSTLLECTYALRDSIRHWVYIHGCVARPPFLNTMRDAPARTRTHK